jgi:predicted nucleic acid-binding protein
VKLIVADSGPLIVFARAGLLGVVAEIAGEILVPQGVFFECTREAAKPGVIAIVEVHHNKVFTVIDQTDSDASPKPRKIENLDTGELAAIALAMARNCSVLMDE